MALKQALFAAITTRMARLGFDPKDGVINLVEAKKEAWWSGDGIAQYVPAR